MKIEVNGTYSLLGEEVTVQSIDDVECVVEDGGGRIVRINCSELKELWRPPPPNPPTSSGCSWCDGQVDDDYQWREKEIVCGKCAVAPIRVAWLADRNALSAEDYPTVELAIEAARKQAEFDSRNIIGVWGGNRLLRAFACGYEFQGCVATYKAGCWGR